MTNRKGVKCITGGLQEFALLMGPHMRKRAHERLEEQSGRASKLGGGGGNEGEKKIFRVTADVIIHH